ncbi:MAG TPA: hypothetical protein VJX10_20785 [Pseudonocardiaceae bacterium]|nr:hypothetical protein [Pseudonocardiaceae bacterium]
MRREDKVLFAVLVVGCFLVPIALGTVLDWPLVLTALLVVTLLVVTWFAARQLTFRRGQDALRAEQSANETARLAVTEPAPADGTRPGHPDGTRMAGVPLPCAEAGYRMLLSATVHWRPAPNSIGMRHTNPEALALESIRARASELTAHQAPGDHQAVGYQLSAALGMILPDVSGQVVAWASDVSLSIPDDDAARLRKISDLRKHEQVWDQERGLERTMRAYLRDEVLDSPGSAVVWWLARHPEQVEDTARLIGPLSRLSAAVHGTPVRDLFDEFVPHQVGSPDTPALDPAPPRSATADALADELSDLAGRIRHLLGAQEPLDR